MHTLQQYLAATHLLESRTLERRPLFIKSLQDVPGSRTTINTSEVNFRLLQGLSFKLACKYNTIRRHLQNQKALLFCEG